MSRACVSSARGRGKDTRAVNEGLCSSPSKPLKGVVRGEDDDGVICASGLPKTVSFPVSLFQSVAADDNGREANGDECHVNPCDMDILVCQNVPFVPQGQWSDIPRPRQGSFVFE